MSTRLNFIALYLAVSSAVHSPHYPPGFPLPLESNIFVKKAYTVSLNLANHMPNYVLEKLDDSIVRGDVSRFDHSFHIDQDVISRLPHYTCCTFDPKLYMWSRGHGAPAAGHKASYTEMAETHLLPSNVYPQDAFNNLVDWRMLERRVVNFVRQKPGHIYVATVPMWVPNEPNASGRRRISVEMIGDKKNIPVPNFLAKVLKYVDGSGNEYSSAVAIPNETIWSDKQPHQYAVPIEFIEKHTGLDFSGLKASEDLFANFPDDGPKTPDVLTAMATRRVNWVLEAKNMKRLKELAQKCAETELLSVYNTDLVGAIVEKYRELSQPPAPPVRKQKLTPKDILDKLMPPKTNKYLPEYYQARKHMYNALEAYLNAELAGELKARSAVLYKNLPSRRTTGVPTV